MFFVCRCLWCNGYRRRKWTRRHEFKSWTRLIAFHIALIPLGKVWIQLFSLQLWVNSRADWVLQPWGGNYSWRRKTLNSNLLNLTLCHILPERRGWVNRMSVFSSFLWNSPPQISVCMIFLITNCIIWVFSHRQNYRKGKKLYIYIYICIYMCVCASHLKIMFFTWKF